MATELDQGNGPRILIIEDEPTIVEFLSTGLSYEGYEPVSTTKGQEGLDYAKKDKVDLIILDIMLPDIDGFEVCRKLRSLGSKVPIIMLTAKKEISDKVTGLDLGADDYLTKPFSFKELLARIRALLRRSGLAIEVSELCAGDIVLNTETRQVKKADKKIYLTPTEFELLKLFMRHPRRVFTRETLLNRVWGYNYMGDTNIVDVHISHLRDKIADKPPRMIRSHYGVGYAFYPEGEE